VLLILVGILLIRMKDIFSSKLFFIFEVCWSG